MKYRDILTSFLFVLFLLTLGFALGVNPSIWYVPIIVFVILIYFVYKLWIEK